MDGEWSDWFEHDGNSMPVPEGHYMAAFSAEMDGSETYTEGINNGFSPCWFGGGADGHGTFWCPVIRYRIRKPKALLALIDMVQALPAPQPEEVA
jgi:hypothetical protein